MSKLKVELFTDAMTGLTCQMWSITSRVFSPPAHKLWLAEWGRIPQSALSFNKIAHSCLHSSSSFNSLTSTSYRHYEVQGQTKRWRRRNRRRMSETWLEQTLVGEKHVLTYFSSHWVANSLKAWHPLSNYHHSLEPKVTFMLKYMAVSVQYIMSPGQNRMQYITVQFYSYDSPSI